MTRSTEGNTTVTGMSSVAGSVFSANATCNANGTTSIIEDTSSPAKCLTRHLDAATISFLIIYLMIFMVGIIGNGLVIIVILKYKHLKTVTNLYILNLSIADSFFLLVLPLTITVGIAEHWIFGAAMCKLFFTLDCVNKFMSAFILTLMAGDRYLAACHPVSSLTYRTSKYASGLLCFMWALAFVVMSPAIYFAGLEPTCSGTYSCGIQWPNGSAKYGNIFTAYTFILGFVLPVICICTFYAMIIARLRRGGIASMPQRRYCQFRKATRLVTVVISAFIGCWLPYWCIQGIILLTYSSMAFRFYQVFTALSYTNSMLNPLLYGFTNEYFREAFNSVFHCRQANVVVADTCKRATQACEPIGACGEGEQSKKECVPLHSRNNSHST